MPDLLTGKSHCPIPVLWDPTFRHMPVYVIQMCNCSPRREHEHWKSILKHLRLLFSFWNRLQVLERWKQERQACKVFPSHFSNCHFCFYSQGSEKKEREGKQNKTQQPRGKISWKCLGAWAQFLQHCACAEHPQHQAGEHPLPVPSPRTQRGNTAAAKWPGARVQLIPPHRPEYFREES